MPTHETDFFKGFGIEKFVVFEGVLPPEESVMGRIFPKFLFENKSIYQNAEVLELGTGSGILGLVMAKQGAKKVVATDILDICKKNTQENARIQGVESILEARQGDLFACIHKNEKFDLIVFNHPLLCGKQNQEKPISVAILAGKSLIERFLTEAPMHLKPNGKILQAFSEHAEKHNDPKTHAKKYGFNCETITEFETETGKKFFYFLSLKNSNSKGAFEK